MLYKRRTPNTRLCMQLAFLIDGGQIDIVRRIYPKGSRCYCSRAFDLFAMHSPEITLVYVLVYKFI